MEGVNEGKAPKLLEDKRKGIGESRTRHIGFHKDADHFTPQMFQSNYF
jgi:hypothetical protein